MKVYISPGVDHTVHIARNLTHSIQLPHPVVTHQRVVYLILTNITRVEVGSKNEVATRISTRVLIPYYDILFSIHIVTITQHHVVESKTLTKTIQLADHQVSVFLGQERRLVGGVVVCVELSLPSV